MAHLTFSFLRRPQPPRGQSILELSSGASHKSPGVFDVDGFSHFGRETKKSLD